MSNDEVYNKLVFLPVHHLIVHKRRFLECTAERKEGKVTLEDWVWKRDGFIAAAAEVERVGLDPCVVCDADLGESLSDVIKKFMRAL